MKKYLGLSISIVLALSGCGGSDSSSKIETATKALKSETITTKSVQTKTANESKEIKIPTTSTVIKSAKVYQPKDISRKSNPDYNCNTSGVITSSTLTKWLDNWSENKPEGVDGRLIVVQAGKTRFDHNRSYLPHNDKDVLVYAIPGAGSCDPSYKRFDGTTNTPGAMIAGNLFDKNINFFQIDPKKDFVVISIAEGSTGVREVIRTWWSMIYWGWDMDRIAFLNGSVEYNYQNSKDYLVATSSPNPKMVAEYHMSDLKTDRTSLHLYMDEVKDIVANSKKGFFLADARGTKEYSGAKKSKTASKKCGPNHDKQCYSAFKGHIKGAVDFPYTDMLVMDDGKCDLNGDGKVDKHDASYKFKSYDELKDLYACKGFNSCDTVIGYCRTGRKSTILALTSTVVLGYPFRMYDGSWIQWGSMANVKDTNGDYILPEDSKVRLDVEKYSEIVGYNNSLDVEPKGIYEIDLNSTDGQNIKREDQAYLAK